MKYWKATTESNQALIHSVDDRTTGVYNLAKQQPLYPFAQVVLILAGSLRENI